MKTRFKLLGQILAFILVGCFCLKSVAQTNVFNFTTTLGNGSFTLDLNNLTLVGGASNTATYFDSIDLLSFNGNSYDHLSFTVINDLSLLNQFDDGFIVQAGLESPINPPFVYLIAIGRGSLIGGNSISDLFTVLSSFDTFYSEGGVYPAPRIDFQPDSVNPKLSGNLNSFQLVNAPEPASWSLLGIGIISLLICRRHFLKAC